MGTSAIEESPRYAISMSAELVYQARTVVLLANGARKTGPICEPVLGPVSCDVPVSCGQTFVDKGGTLVHVLDEPAAADLLARRSEVEARGYEIIDVRDQPCKRVPDLAFICDPGTGHVR